MLRKENGRVSWLEFSLFQDYPHLVHGVFLRQGGISQAPFDALNASYSVGDSAASVDHNLAQITKALCIPEIIFAKQVHGTRIHEIHYKSSPSRLVGDALITRTKARPLGVLHADCQPAILFDPVAEVVCVLHAGWRGQAAGIYTQAVEKMTAHKGCFAKNILVGIGPSLGPKHAEFDIEKDPLSSIQKRFQVSPRLFNLWEGARHELISRGVLADNIEVAQLCTYENKTDFFSYRRNHATGRNVTVAALFSR